MQDTFDIELSAGTEPPAGAVQLPANFLTVGQIEPDDVRVYIKQDVCKALEEYAASDTGRELGSILLGDYCCEQGRTHVILSRYLEARYTDASASTLTFTHRTWDDIHARHTETCPDKRILGWQHTHPSYGIFLSNYDLFIQENFFDLPFQIAYVIDPVQHLRGFFQWKNGKIEELTGYYVYDDVGKPIRLAREQPPKKAAPAGKAPAALTAALCVLTALLLCGTLWLGLTLRRQQTAQAALEARLTRQQEDMARQEETIAALQAQLSADADTDAPSDGAVRLIPYTVRPGDTLSDICRAAGLDYGAEHRIILGINGIEDPDRIYAGQTLLLPLSP